MWFFVLGVLSGLVIGHLMVIKISIEENKK
jgi:hypothetical protein